MHHLHGKLSSFPFVARLCSILIRVLFDNSLHLTVAASSDVFQDCKFVYKFDFLLSLQLDFIREENARVLLKEFLVGNRKVFDWFGASWRLGF